MSGYCTVSIGSGLVDSIYGNCQVPLKSYLEKRGEAFERESLLKYLFRMENSRHWAERYSAETAMDGFDPSVIGYCWDDEEPRIQLEPRGQRGYIELRAVRRIRK